MSYTDDTVYKLRECTGEYSNTAIELRNEKEYEEVLDKLLADNSIEISNIQRKKIDTASSFTDFVTDALNECIKEYIEVCAALSRQRHINQQKKQLLIRNGIDVNEDNLFL